MTILDVAIQLLAEAERLHDVIEPCDNPDCPTAKAIRDMREAMIANEGAALVVWDDNALKEAMESPMRGGLIGSISDGTKVPLTARHETN